MGGCWCLLVGYSVTASLALPWLPVTSSSVTTKSVSRRWPWGGKLLSMENHCSEVFFLICLFIFESVCRWPCFSLPSSLLPRPGFERLASSLSTRYTAGRRSWLLARPCFGWPKLPVHGGSGWAGCSSQRPTAPSAAASGQQGTYFSVGHTTWCRGDSWMGFHLEVSEDQNCPSLLALKLLSLGSTVCQASSLEGRGKPARERAPVWGQRAGGGSWRPCDCWRLCVSQGRAGPLAHSCAQSEKASHDCSVGACVSGRERRWEGGGSDFRIHAGNTKYICESQAESHHMTPLALPVQKSG